MKKGDKLICKVPLVRYDYDSIPKTATFICGEGNSCTIVDILPTPPGKIKIIVDKTKDIMEIDNINISYGFLTEQELRKLKLNEIDSR